MFGCQERWEIWGGTWRQRLCWFGMIINMFIKVGRWYWHLRRVSKDGSWGCEQWRVTERERRVLEGGVSESYGRMAAYALLNRRLVEGEEVEGNRRNLGSFCEWFQPTAHSRGQPHRVATAQWGRRTAAQEQGVGVRHCLLKGGENDGNSDMVYAAMKTHWNEDFEIDFSSTGETICILEEQHNKKGKCY